MAISVAYGIGIATILTLIVLPVLLAILNDSRVLWNRIWNLKRVSREEVEPAIRELESEKDDA
jgi:predicted RND superfamily exporter protein